MAHLRYLRYVLRHKWFVLLAGLKVGAPLWRLLIHDWSKFLPVEWVAYARYFYGGWRNWPEGPTKEHAKTLVQPAFDRAWLHHQKANKHHWQYWLLNLDNFRPRFVLQSPDGGYTGNRIMRTDQTSRRGLDLPSLDINLEGEAERWHLVRDLVADAARAPIPLEMPRGYLREMVADWMGAGRAITGRWEVAEWYARNRESIQLHPNTRTLVEDLLRRAAASA